MQETTQKKFTWFDFWAIGFALLSGYCWGFYNFPNFNFLLLSFFFIPFLTPTLFFPSSRIILLIFFVLILLVFLHAGALSLAGGFLALALALTCVWISNWSDLKEKKVTKQYYFELLGVIFIFFLSFIILSNLNNNWKIKHDKEIVTNLNITKGSDFTKIILPIQLMKEQPYLSTVLTVKVDDQEDILWQKGAKVCVWEDRIWCEFSLSPDTKVINLHFDHLWRDYDAFFTPATMPDEPPTQKEFLF